MEIAVCVKQVPETGQARLREDTQTVDRGVSLITNPFDRYALEAASGLRDKFGGRVTAFSMGPPSAEEMLRECYMYGADRLILLSDPLFAGADTYATSYVLSEALKYYGPFDLILCGKQTADGDTAQVGPELAEWLNIPQLTCVGFLECDGTRLRVRRELDDCYEWAETMLPALVTATKSLPEPRHPHFSRILGAASAPITVMNADVLPDLQRDRLGLKGSPTQIHQIRQVSFHRETHVLDGNNLKETVSTLVSVLRGENTVNHEQ